MESNMECMRKRERVRMRKTENGRWREDKRDEERKGGRIGEKKSKLRVGVRVGVRVKEKGMILGKQSRNVQYDKEGYYEEVREGL